MKHSLICFAGRFFDVFPFQKLTTSQRFSLFSLTVVIVSNQDVRNIRKADVSLVPFELSIVPDLVSISSAKLYQDRNKRLCEIIMRNYE